MPEPTELYALRELLETTAHQPAFATLRARRRRRTRGRLGAALAAMLTLAVAIGTTVALGGLPGRPPAPATPDSELRLVRGLATDGAGAVYALLQVCPQVGDTCAAENGRYEVHLSRDLGATWSRLGNTPFSGTLRVTGTGQLWLVGQSHVDGRWQAATSVDSGHTWQGTVLWDVPALTTVGDTAWIVAGGTALTATGANPPTPTATFPPGLVAVTTLIAITPDHVVLAGPRRDDNAFHWYETTDRGTRWTERADPCATGPGFASRSTGLSVASDGTWWAICPGASEVTAGQPSPGPNPSRPDVEIRTSADGGQTWATQATLSEWPFASDVLYASSATVAWRYGLGRLARTNDGPTWTVVESPSALTTIPTFLVVDGLRAIAYEMTSPADHVTDRFEHVLRVTRDGGATWTTYDLPQGR